MRSNGIDRWDDIYPNEEIVTNDVNNHSLYVWRKAVPASPPFH
jgi:hypothetical protein